MSASKEFDDTGDVIEVVDYSGIQNIFTDGGNISVWLFIRSLGIITEVGRIWQKNRDVGGFAGRIFMIDDSGNKIGIAQDYGSSETSYNILDNPINFNEWINLSINYNKNSILNTADFYINGILVTSTRTGDTSTASPPNSDSGEAATFGNTAGSNVAFDGFISNMHMYDRELTQPEIKEIMQKPGSIRDGLVGFWPLTDDGSTQRNLAGIGNTGSVTGATNSADGPPVNSFK